MKGRPVTRTAWLMAKRTVIVSPVPYVVPLWGEDETDADFANAGRPSTLDGPNAAKGVIPSRRR